MKRIEVDCGYREQYPNGEIRFYADYSGEGMIYKDWSAWDNTFLPVYIPEQSFTDSENDYVTYDANDIYFSDDILSDISILHPYLDYDLARKVARSVLDELTWTCPYTYISVYDICYDLEDVYKEGMEVFLIPHRSECKPDIWKIGEFKNEECILIYQGELGGEYYSEQEVSLDEIYRLTGERCRCCGKPLYYEKCANIDWEYEERDFCFNCGR